MALLKVKEFGEKYGITRNNVYTYRDRGKLIIVEGFIDEANPINKLFIDSRPTTQKVVQSSKEISQESPKHLEKTTDAISSATRPKNSKESETVEALNRIALLKEQKLRAEIEGLELANKVKSGELIPIDFASNVFGIFLRNVASTFYNSADNYTLEVCNKLSAERELLAEFRGFLKKVVNESVHRAKEMAKKDLESFSTTIQNGDNVAAEGD